jgi:hypothetical protein
VALLQELYQLSDENRTFLHSRLLPNLRRETIDAIKSKLATLTSQKTVFAGRFSHVAIKRLVDQYHKAADDPAGVAELLIADIDFTLATFNSIGGDDEAMVDHAYACRERRHTTLQSLKPDLRPPLCRELHKLGSRWQNKFGYGISDELWDMAVHWEKIAASVEEMPATENCQIPGGDAKEWPE